MHRAPAGGQSHVLAASRLSWKILAADSMVISCGPGIHFGQQGPRRGDFAGICSAELGLQVGPERGFVAHESSIGVSLYEERLGELLNDADEAIDRWSRSHGPRLSASRVAFRCRSRQSFTRAWTISATNLGVIGLSGCRRRRSLQAANAISATFSTEGSGSPPCAALNTSWQSLSSPRWQNSRSTSHIGLRSLGGPFAGAAGRASLDAGRGTTSLDAGGRWVWRLEDCTASGLIAHAAATSRVTNRRRRPITIG